MTSSLAAPFPKTSRRNRYPKIVMRGVAGSETRVRGLWTGSTTEAVCLALAAKLTDREIAAELGISPAAVWWYTQNLRRAQRLCDG